MKKRETNFILTLKIVRLRNKIKAKTSSFQCENDIKIWCENVDLFINFGAKTLSNWCKNVIF